MPTDADAFRRLVRRLCRERDLNERTRLSPMAATLREDAAIRSLHIYQSERKCSMHQAG